MTWPPSCIRSQEPLARHTSFRIGGPAEWFAEPSTLEELVLVLRQAMRLGLPVCVVGGGTNTLATDRGVRGLTIHLGREFRTFQILSSPESSTAEICCGSALLTQRLVSLAAEHGWGGLEALTGLPGQVGGAVVMNAQDIGRFVQTVQLVRFDGRVEQVSREQLGFRYRDAELPSGIVAEVRLKFPKAPPADVAAQVACALLRRNRTQELRLPSAGCAFKNPGGVSAGRLIDEAGLKGTRIGDAAISPRHANFIVNLGHATCDEVLALMEYVQHRVRQRFGLQLEPEVRVLGERCR